MKGVSIASTTLDGSVRVVWCTMYQYEFGTPTPLTVPSVVAFGLYPRPSLAPRLRSRTPQEDEKLLQLRGQQGKSFAKIAGEIDGRSYNDVKNRWSQISRQIAALKVKFCLPFSQAFEY